MDRTNARTGQHRHRRLRDHRHVNDNPVTLGHPLGMQGPGKAGNLITQPVIGECFNRIGDRAVINQGCLFAAAIFDMTIQRVKAGIDHPALEPAIKRRVAVIKHTVPFPVPDQIFRSLGPETFPVRDRTIIDFLIATRHL